MSSTENETKEKSMDQSTKGPSAGGTLAVEVVPEVFAAVPGYRRVVVLCRVADPSCGASTVRTALAGASAALHEGLSPDGILAVPEVDAWRTAFRAVGINPSKHRPALEALVRRAVRGDDLVLGTTLVDLGTAVSLATRCPVGMHAVDGLVGEAGLTTLALRRASGDEAFTEFNGTSASPDSGELVYVAGSRVLTRRWAWRQGPYGSIRGQEPHVLAINLDVLDRDPNPPRQMMLGLLDACAAEVVEVIELTADRPSAGPVAW